jgi:hypothetical protein
VTQNKKGKNSLYAQGNNTMISRVAMVGIFTRKKLTLQRKLCWGLSMLSPTADLRECWVLRDASILNWEKKRERQVIQF